MKKFMFILTTVVMSLFMVSCNPETQPQTDGTYPGVIYNVTVNGDADGNLQVTFPNGEFGLDGTAGLVFLYSNDTVQVANALLLTEETIQANGDSTQLAALYAVNEFVDQNFAVTTGGGTYDIRIRGYVKEPITGLSIAIDRRFTNREQ